MTDRDNSPEAPLLHHAVMVSSTFTDLRELRQILIDAARSVGLFAEAMEYDAAKAGADLIESSLLKVRHAAGYALLIGHRYGQQPVCAIRNPKNLSITELEFDEAIAGNKAIVVIILGEKYPLSAAQIDRSDALVRKLAAFRQRAISMDGSGEGVPRVYVEVNSEKELQQAAVPTMHDLARELDKRAAPPAPNAPSERATQSERDELPPAPPAPYEVPPYIGSHAFVGRRAELDLLDDWAAAEDQHPMLLFDAIGGSGKSMLTWHWFDTRAATRRKWAGRFWYSFYEDGASMAECCRRALAYMTGRPPADFQRVPTSELARELLCRLRDQPWLLVLDGLERVLVAYHRSDAATIADEALAQPTDQIGDRHPCDAARPEDDDLLRQLTAADPSKILITSRLMPQALLNRAHQPIPGMRRESLRGLRPEDAVYLLQREGVRGDAAAMQRFVQAHCDGHPLVVGALAGLIVDFVPAPDDFDAWSAHPSGGMALDLGMLDLVQKRNHILRAALAAVPEKGRELLATLALLHGGVDGETIEALNPHRPAEPVEVPEPEKPEAAWDWDLLDDRERAKRRQHYSRQQSEHAAYLKAHSAWLASPDKKAASAKLARTLRDLQRRGLLQRGEGPHAQYDLHPVVRGIVSAALSSDDTARLGQRVVDYFSQRIHGPYLQAEALQDLAGGFHVVRTLLRMGRFEQALGAWRGDLGNAAMFNVLAWDEILALLKPFFPGGWLQPPEGLDDRGRSYLMNSIAIALQNCGMREQATQVYGAKLRFDAYRRAPASLRVGLANFSSALRVDNHLADSRMCAELALRIAEASGQREELFRARLDLLANAAIIGDWPRAETLWTSLDAMGRDWPHAIYQPGTAERWRAIALWWQGRSPAEALATAERLARDAKVRIVLCEVLRLRGEWQLVEGNAAASVEAFDELSRLTRASGRSSLAAECWLAVARLNAGQLADPRAEAERLQAAGARERCPLAKLWQTAGDLAEARRQALDYYRWASADGEPFVRRFDLERARTLLTELGETIPDLPPYDPARRKRFDWQDDVEAAIRALEQEKAEEDAEQAKRVAKKAKRDAKKPRRDS